MKIIDAPTAFLITGLLYLLMPSVVWLSLRRQKIPAVANWSMGGGLFGLCLVLVTFRGHAPEWLTYEVAVLCLFVGNTLRVQALRQQLGQPLSTRMVLLLIAVMWLPYEAARMGNFLNGLYAIWTLVATACCFFWMAWLAHQIGKKEQISTARGLSGAYVPLGLMLLVRAVQIMLGEGANMVIAYEYTSVLIAFVGIVSAVLGNASFMGMYVERSARQQLQQTREQARREENARLGSQIAQLDRQRSMGLISMSLAHELSQPLTSISLITEHARAMAHSQPQAVPGLSPYLDDLQRHTQNAIAIMERIRGFIRARPVQHQSVSLQEVIRNVSSLMGDWIKGERVVLQVKAPAQPLIVQGDPVQLAQVLVNLVRNAVQATAGRPQRLIEIGLDQQGQHALLQVQDNGPGFGQQQMEEADKPMISTKPEGMGMGLVISRHIAEQHSGMLSLSNNPFGGALVTFALPMA